MKDEELAKLVQEKNLDAFTILVERYESKLTRYGKRFLFEDASVEDAVQRVFLKTYKNIQGFDISRKFSSWIYRIAHNEFINIIKKKHRDPFLFFDPDIIFNYPSKENILEKIKKDEEKRDTEELLGDLKPKYREILILYYFEDKDYREISDILKIPVSTVGVRLKRAKEKIKTNYEKRKR